VVLALARLVGQPEAYGLELPAIPNEPYFSVEVEHQVDLGVLADRVGIPREELIALNPAFNRWATAPDGPHRVLVPVATEAAFASALAALPAERRLRFAHHRVRAGDTLWALARRYGLSIDALRRGNRWRVT
jgi:membrane-bound lytic murein transglycosylase D